jgi:hypothetical protein
MRIGALSGVHILLLLMLLTTAQLCTIGIDHLSIVSLIFAEGSAE